MMRPLTRWAVIFGILGVLLLTGGAVAATVDTADIGTDHDLATDEAMNEYQDSGLVEGDVDRYQMEVAVADSVDDVGADDAVITDIRNTFVRLNYQEDHPRELRILIPRDVMTPYQADQDSLTTDHTVEIEPAREREYISMTVTVDGPADIVVPLAKEHGLSQSFLERTDERIEQLTGWSPMDRAHEWEYIDGDNVTESGIDVDKPLDDTVIQFDATPDSSDDSWVNVPKRDRGNPPVYINEIDGSNEFELVATTNETPEVRYRTEGTLGATVRGYVNDARNVVSNAIDNVGDLIPW